MSEVDAVANEFEFKLVVTKKGKYRPKHRSNPKSSLHQLGEKDRIARADFCQKTVLTQLQHTEEELLQSEFLRDCTEAIEPILAGVQDIICLGLGNFLDCTIARYQLAFIRCLRDTADRNVRGQFFDPVFTQPEVDTLHALGETVLRENLEGKHCAERKTLFFLPHCPKQIVNNVLWKNWHPDRLANVVLLCNSFSTVVNSNPDRLLRTSAGYILRAAHLFEEVPLRNSFRFGDIFNDTSLHHLKADRAKQIDWESTVEPSYDADDLELVSKAKLARLEFV